MRKLIDGSEILDSGTIVLVRNQGVRFVFEQGFVVNFDFESGDASQANDIQGSVINNELHLKFTNFQNVLGSANREPLELGKIGAEKVMLNFAITGVGDKENFSRIVSYTFWKQHDVNDRRMA